MTLSNDQMMIRSIIIDRYENPKFKVANADGLEQYERYNNRSDSCIDNLTVYLKIENKAITDVKFSGEGCAVSTATTDFMCELMLNKSLEDARKIIKNYENMISLKEFDREILGELTYFENSGKQTSRVKCALVGHGAIFKILEDQND